MSPERITTTSAQAYAADPRNDDVLVYLNGDFVPKDQLRNHSGR
jgi:hypothetical protein